MQTTSQVSDPDMIELIRRKLRLHAPYAGAFLKKTERYSPLMDVLLLSGDCIVVKMKW